LASEEINEIEAIVPEPQGARYGEKQIAHACSVRI